MTCNMQRSSLRQGCTATLAALLLLHTVCATDCPYLLGCLSCTQQRTQHSAPKLPGYTVPPYPSRNTHVGIAAGNVYPENHAAQTDDAESASIPGGLAAALKSASDALMGMKRSLKELYFSTTSDPQGVSDNSNSGGAVYGSSLPGSSSASSLDREGMPFSTATTAPSAAQTDNRSPQLVHAASSTGEAAVEQAQLSASGPPLVLAPPVLQGQLDGQIPLVYAEVTPEQQHLDILTTDPKADGPHPWDVLLFKTDQFNTTRPAYRLGGLGLMLMADFNDSQPLTDWHTKSTALPPVQQQQQQQTASSDWSSNPASQEGVVQSSDHGQGGSVFGQLSQMVRQAGSSTKTTQDIRLKASPNTRPMSLVEQLKGMLQKLNRGGSGDKKNAVFSIASSDGPKRLWCTACQAPAYRLTEFGHCVCAAGYGRILDSSSPYSCMACPPGQVASTAAIVNSKQPGPTDVRLQPPGSEEPQPAAAMSVLSVCVPCPKATVPNQERTACVAP